MRHRTLLLILLMLVLCLMPVSAWSVSINSLTFNNNSFDNGYTSNNRTGSTTLTINFSGAPTNQGRDSDTEKGFRVEVYDADGNLVRRLASGSIDRASMTAWWNGKGDYGETLPYGIYTMRVYSSLSDPVFLYCITGVSGIIVDYPRDIHVSSNNVILWTNRDLGLVCQVTQPHSTMATLVRQIEHKNMWGQLYGVTATSNGDIFFSDQASTRSRIVWYDVSADAVGDTDFFVTAPQDGTNQTTINMDILYGLGSGHSDTLYWSAYNGGTYADEREGPWAINGNSGAQVGLPATKTYGNTYDVAVHDTDLTRIYGLDRQNQSLDRYGIAAGSITRTKQQACMPGADCDGVWYLKANNSLYLSDIVNNKIQKFTMEDPDKGTAVAGYTANGTLSSLRGIAVWTNGTDTYVYVCSEDQHLVRVYREAANGQTATFYRDLKDDPYNVMNPYDLQVDLSGNLYVIGNKNHYLKKYDITNTFAPFAGSPNADGYLGGPGNHTDSVYFEFPTGVAVDSSGYIYVIDSDTNTGGGDFAIKKFTATGGASNDFNGGASNVRTYNITQSPSSGRSAVWANNSIYVASEDKAAFNITRVSAAGATLATRNLNRKFFEVASGPYYRRNGDTLYPNAIYAVGDSGIIAVMSESLDSTLFAPVKHPNTVTTSNARGIGLDVDEFGEVYITTTQSRSRAYLERYSMATGVANFAETITYSYAFPYGKADTEVWGEAFGFTLVPDPATGKKIYKRNPMTGKYEIECWLTDFNDYAVKKYRLTWEDVREVSVVIQPTDDTPTVVAATLKSDTMFIDLGSYYVGAGLCTFTIYFNHDMDPTLTPVVQYIPNGGSLTSINQVSYTGNIWTGTAVIPTGYDGQAEIVVRNAYDSTGITQLQIPNPDSTDDDLADDFKPFYIDSLGPNLIIFNPPESDTVAINKANYLVYSVTEAGAYVYLMNYTAFTGGTLIDTSDGYAGILDGNSYVTINLLPPVNYNYITGFAMDQLGNRGTTVTPRHVIKTVNEIYQAYINPNAATQIDEKKRWQITVIAKAQITSGTVSITVPDGWTQPQTGASGNEGYVTTTAGVVSVIGSNVIRITGLNLLVGDVFFVNYGDSIVSTNARVGPEADADLGDNYFQITGMDGGDTQWTEAVAPSGQQLFVEVYDNPVYVEITETWAASDTDLDRGEQDVLVMRLKFTNNNLGNHTDKITSLKLTLADSVGAAVIPNTVVNEITAKYGSFTYDLKSSGEIEVSGQTITLDFTADDPFEILYTGDRYLYMDIYIDVKSTATATSVRFGVADTAAITAVDKATNYTIGVSAPAAGSATGLRNTTWRIITGKAPADTCWINCVDMNAGTVVKGQTSVDVMKLTLTNPQDPDTPVNTIKVTNLVFRFIDHTNTGCTPASVISGIRILDISTGEVYSSLGAGLIPTVPDSIAFLPISNLFISGGDSVELKVVVDIVSETVDVSIFSLQLTETYVTVEDNILGTAVPAKDNPNYADTLPFRINNIRIINQARVTNTKILLFDNSNNPISQGSIVVGTVFKILFEVYADPGRSDAYLISEDTDFVLRINGTDSTVEFTITADSGSMRLYAGTYDTIVYTVQQTAGNSTGTLFVNNDTGLFDTYPVFYDWLDRFAPDPLRIYPIEGLNSWDSLTIIAKKLIAAAEALSQNYASPNETGVLVLKFTVTNNATPTDTFDSVVLHSLNSRDSEVTDVNLYVDDGDEVFEPGNGQDTLLTTGTDTFNSSGYLTLFGLGQALEGGVTRRYWVSYTVDDTPITDGGIMDLEIPVNGISTTGGKLEVAALNSSGTVSVEVVAILIDLYPDSTITAAYSGALINIRAIDRFGNIDAAKNNEAGTQAYQAQITCTFAPIASGYFSAHTLNPPLNPPAPGVGVVSQTGKLNNGVATITLTDTQNKLDTIYASATITCSNALIQFTSMITATANTVKGRTTGIGAQPDTDWITVMKFTITNATGASQWIDSITVRNLNTVDTEADSVVLWLDLNNNGILDTGIDSYVAAGDFSAGNDTLFFDVYVRVNSIGDSVFFVSYNVPVRVTDQNTLDLEVQSIQLLDGQELVTAGYLNSTPLNSADIEVTADSIVIWPATGSTIAGQTAIKYIEATDRYGNEDREYSQTIEVILSGDGFFLSSSLGGQVLNVGGDPGRIRGTMNAGSDTLAFTDLTVEIITVTCDVSPAPANSANNIAAAQEFTSAGKGTVAFFLNSNGYRQTDTYATTDSIYMVLTDASRNFDNTLKDTVFVTVRDYATLDTEIVVLTESANTSGIFDNWSVGLLIEENAVGVPADSKLQVNGSDSIEVYWNDANEANDTSIDTATIRFIPVPSFSISYFINAAVLDTAWYTLDYDSIYVLVTDRDRNTDRFSQQTVLVTIRSLISLDTEIITLTEVTINADTLTNTVGNKLKLSLWDGSSTVDDDTLEAIAGETITITYSDATLPGDLSMDTAWCRVRSTAAIVRFVSLTQADTWVEYIYDSCYIFVTDLDNNRNGGGTESIQVMLIASSGDTILVTLTETGRNTGGFTNIISRVPRLNLTDWSIIPGDDTFEVYHKDNLVCSYTDRYDPTDSGTDSASVLLVYSAVLRIYDGRMTDTTRVIIGDSVYLVLTDLDADEDSNQINTVLVTIRDSDSGETQLVVLTEIGICTGVFSNRAVINGNRGDHGTRILSAGTAYDDYLIRDTGWGIVYADYTDSDNPADAPQDSMVARVLAIRAGSIYHYLESNGRDSTPVWSVVYGFDSMLLEGISETVYIFSGGGTIALTPVSTNATGTGLDTYTAGGTNPDTVYIIFQVGTGSDPARSVYDTVVIYLGSGQVTFTVTIIEPAVYPGDTVQVEVNYSNSGRLPVWDFTFYWYANFLNKYETNTVDWDTGIGFVPLSDGDPVFLDIGRDTGIIMNIGQVDRSDTGRLRFQMRCGN